MYFLTRLKLFALNVEIEFERASKARSGILVGRSRFPEERYQILAEEDIVVVRLPSVEINVRSRD